MKKSTIRKSKIGGQALIEGVMMRGLDRVAMAVRLPNGSIDLESWQADDLANPKWYRRVPILRGCIGLVESMTLGYRCLMKSAEKSNPEPDADPSGKTGVAYRIAGIVGIVLGILLAVGLFAVLPSLLVKGLGSFLPIQSFRTLLEGGIKILLLVGYLAVVSSLKEMRKTFCYHGAEHKTIACYEADAPLTPDQVRQYSRFHPRCGTSFLLIVLLVSILLFSLLTWDDLILRIVLKLLLLPVVVGVSYEIIRLAGRYDNWLTRVVSAPGLWLQRLTTREPDDAQLQVAIAALEAVRPTNPDLDQW